MPIRFACTACGQKLSISTRQAGNQVTCPRCQKATVVPKVASPPAEATSTPSPAPPQTPTNSPEVAPSQPTLPESEITAPPVVQEGSWEPVTGDDDMPAFLLYDNQDASPASKLAGGGPPANLLNRSITVPRYVVYAQGALLAVVGLVSLSLGILIGGTLFHSPAANAVPEGPVTVQGTITYAQNNRRVADEGALIAVLPDIKDPGARVKPQGLNPGQAIQPEAVRKATEQVQNMGGGLAYADAKGNYQLKLPAGGKFFILVISAHQGRSEDQVQVDDIRRIGRFFEGATEVLGTSRHKFSQQTLRADTRLNEAFD
ncbi:MAG: hypothetical protein ACO1RA_19640 [Planctomycetaceae bacterium]